MINREEILTYLDKANDQLIIFEKSRIHNIENQLVLENYKKEFLMFRFNMNRLNDNMVIGKEIEQMIDKFMDNVKLINNIITNINQQNK